MSNNFPLYDRLSKDIPAKKLTIKQKSEFLNKVSSIDVTGAETIYVLIRVYQMENNEGDISTYTLPYGGKYINNNMNFDLNEIPNSLSQILYKFINIHFESKEEENTFLSDRF